jgi:processive 1,2-diacylglycerol beta-glucosyltransferase
VSHVLGSRRQRSAAPSPDSGRSHQSTNSPRDTTGPFLILSGSIGQGHSTVAAVCRGALEKAAAGSKIEVVDCIELLGPVSGRIAERLFRASIAFPALYDGFHFAHLRAEGALAAGGDRQAVGRILRRLEKRRLLEATPRLALAVFATGAPVAARIAAEHPGAKAVVFCTDATAHSKWVPEGIDLFVVTSELTAASLRRYQPRAEVAIVPPPVRPQFLEAPPQEQARRTFGVPPEVSCVLLVSGGWGLGPLAASAGALVAAGHHVLAVAGHNKRLKRELDLLAVRQERLVSLGYCDDMAAAISAADVVVSGSGQTCKEVHAVGRRLVVLDVVPGHGRENLLHEVTTTTATAASPHPGSVLGAVENSLKSDEQPEPWPVKSPEEWNAKFRAALGPLGID